MATIALTPVNLRDLVEQTHQLLTVRAEWATADEAGVAAFEAWLDEWSVTREQHDEIAADEPDRVFTRRGKGDRFFSWDRNGHLVAVSTGGHQGCWTWTELAAGGYLGGDDLGSCALVPEGEAMPEIEGYEEVPAED